MDSDEARQAQLFLEALHRGVDLFNQQRFFEAYEVWQERWTEEAGEGADLLQGLLQVAVGFSKLTDGNPRGTVKLFETGRNKLLAYAPRAYDLDISAILSAIRHWQDVAERMLERGGDLLTDLPKLLKTEH